MCVFLAHKRGDDSDAHQPIALASVAPAIRQSTRCELTASDLALLRGILGNNALELVQMPTDAASTGLGFLLHTGAVATRQGAKRRRTAKPDPVRLVAGLLDMFNDGTQRVRQQQEHEQRPLDDILDEIALENMPSAVSRSESNTTPLTADEFLESLRQDPLNCGQIVDSATRNLSPVAAQFQDPSSVIDDSVWAALGSRGVRRLYTHQAEAIDHVLQGRSVVISTATASGKSAIYQVPILQMLLHDQTARFLLIFPTKALAQDQAASLSGLLAHIPALRHIHVCALDGDTPSHADGSDERRRIRRTASVILTNPDTLHQAMLPNTAGWALFWAQLKLVVIDELHVYQGLFGQHMAMILARLRRFCSPQYVACSATTSNPLDHMRELTRIPDIALVSTDGAPRGRRSMVLWDSQQQQQQPGHQHHTSVVTLATNLLRSGLRGIVFCKQRQKCELVFRELSDTLDDSTLRDSVVSYRGGYTASERRDIERRLFAGELRLVIATSALELGVDVGSLDVVLMVGMPMTIASLWQQAGRAGRQQQSSLAMVVATGAPLDRALLKDPDVLFSRPLPPATIACEDSIVRAHLQCAAFERRLDPDDPILSLLTDGSHDLVWDAATDTWCCALQFKPWPPLNVPIRSAQRTRWAVVVRSSHQLLEELDEWHALFALYEGGILLHRGHTYAIDLVDADHSLALASYSDVSWHTRPRDHQDATPTRTDKHIRLSPTTSVLYGAISICVSVFGYRRIDTKTKRVVELVDHSSPPLSLSTVGLWVDVPTLIARALAVHGVEASIHAAQHALLAAVSTAVKCAASDLTTECKSPMARRTKLPRLVVYETAPGPSSGPTHRALAASADILRSAMLRIATCECDDGCASCVFMSTCHEQNQCTSKPGALLLLQKLSKDTDSSNNHHHREHH